MDAKTLASAAGIPLVRAQVWAGFLSAAMDKYEINTPARQAAFIAQVGHESMSFMRTLEIWGPTPPQARYEGRIDLGNTQRGDGKRFMGRGLIQITGRDNYAKASKALGVDVVKRPELLQGEELASLSAAWWWKTHGLNELADAGLFAAITRKINGGLTGQDKREALWKNAKAALGVQ